MSARQNRRRSYARAGKSTWVEVKPGEWRDVSRLEMGAITKLIYLNGATVRDLDGVAAVAK
jgi:hypothetical protein